MRKYTNFLFNMSNFLKYFIFLLFIIDGCGQKTTKSYQNQLADKYAKIIIYHNKSKLAVFENDSIYKSGLSKLYQEETIDTSKFWDEIDNLKSNAKDWNLFLIDTKIKIDSLNKL